MQSWNPPALSLLPQVDGSGVLVDLFTSLARELAAVYAELEELKRRVETK
jgi:hypothetical protein